MFGIPTKQSFSHFDDSLRSFNFLPLCSTKLHFQTQSPVRIELCLQKSKWHSRLALATMTLFGNSVFADVAGLRRFIRADLKHTLTGDLRKRFG